VERAGHARSKGLTVAIVRRQQQFARRVVGYTFLGDVVVSGLVYLAISHFIGAILFMVGLVVTGAVWSNMRQVLRTRGYR
jgi:ABC-type multidrug transport system permease subunit